MNYGVGDIVIVTRCVDPNGRPTLSQNTRYVVSSVKDVTMYLPRKSCPTCGHTTTHVIRVYNDPIKGIPEHMGGWRQCCFTLAPPPSEKEIEAYKEKTRDTPRVLENT